MWKSFRFAPALSCTALLCAQDDGAYTRMLESKRQVTSNLIRKADEIKARAEYQRHGISSAQNGYAAFILDSIQIAETFGLHHGVFSQEM